MICPRSTDINSASSRQGMMIDDRFLTRAEVEQRFSIARSTIYRLMRSGAFPEPIRVGPRAVRWRASDLDAWLASRPYARGEAERAAG